MTSSNLTGMDRNTGKVLSDVDHIAQSIGDILPTPIGTRAMRRGYGSLQFELSDVPLHRATSILGFILIVSAAAMAIARWEPRIDVTQISLSGDFASGQAVSTVTGAVVTQTGAIALITLSIPLTS